MRRGWAVCLALVLLAGCSRQTPPDQSNIKQAFIRELVGFCAEVDRQLATVKQNVQPGKFADQFERFASQARAQTPPPAERNQLDILLADIDGVVRHFRSAETARSNGDDTALKAALAQANRQLTSADAAAQKYGMPPLKECPKHMSPTPSPTATTSAPPTATTSAPPAATTSAPPSGGWQARQESRVAVQQVGAAVVRGRIWIAGGLTDAVHATATTEVYDPTLDAWDPGPPLPYAVHHAMVVAYRNQVVVIGGFMSHGTDALASTSDRMLILQDGQWVDGPKLHHPRGAGAAAVVGNQIVVVGGRTGHPKQLVTQTEIYDGTSWHDVTAIPVPGDHLAAASDGTYLYAAGGRNIVPSTNKPALQRYDPNTDRWTQLPAMRRPLSGVGAAVIGGQLIVVGGESTTSAFATVNAYNLTTSAWTSLPALTQARHGLAVAAIGTTLYAIDGATQPGHTASTNTVEALTFS